MEYFFTLLFMVYLAPWIVSEWRERDDSAAILALNLFTGWTLVGWVGALWWAGADLLPERARARPALYVVPPPAVRTPHGSRRLAALAAPPLAALLLAAGADWATRAAPALATERVAVEALVLHALPQSSAREVGRLPRGCAVAVVERRGEWRRLWRTADCPGVARGRAAGWVRGAVTR